jgi:leucyl-tRNA synthetase
MLTFGGKGKMSKSKGNVVNPDAYMARYGADTLRLHIMFLGPFLEGGEWNERGMLGQARFLERVWRGVLGATSDDLGDPTRERRRHRTIAAVEAAIESLHYNTAIAALHELARAIDEEAREGTARRVDARALVELLAPFAPHIADELWERLGESGTVHRGSWPEHDPALAASPRVTIAVQVNGRLRTTFECDAGTPASELERLALDQPRVVELLGGRPPRKVIAVPDRIVNLVI